jgi:DNA-binding transcriptional LysR family regulator
MAKIADWDDHIGRRLRLRDLRVFFAVVQAGSLAKAAVQLRVSQPAVSQVIADLEHALGVKLFDRSSRGIELTVYARALLTRGRAAFDELRQGIRDIEFLSDPEAGELAIGYAESLAFTVLPQMIARFSEEYPRVVMRTDVVPSPAINFAGLRARTHDVVFARMPTPLLPGFSVEDLNVEVLFDDPLVVVAGAQSPWARRRKIDLADLIDEPWILSPPGTFAHARIGEAFRARGLKGPRASLVTFAVDLRAKLPYRGRFITAVPRSVLRLDRERPTLKKLPIGMPSWPWPVVILTLKNRTLSPVVERFIACAREVAKSIVSKPRTRNS